MNFQKWLPTGKITAVAFGAAIGLLILVFLSPGWEQEWMAGAFVGACAAVAGYLMPEMMPWNRRHDSET